MGSPVTITPDPPITPPQVTITPDAPQSQPGKFAQAWQKANTGLVSGDTLLNASNALTPSAPNQRPGESTAQYVSRVGDPRTTPIDPDHPILSGIRTGIAGATKDASNMLSGFTSPVSIATMGLGALGKAGGTLGTIGKSLSGLIGTGFAAKGVADSANAVSDIASNGATPENTQNLLYGGAQMAGGTAGAADSMAGSSPKAASALNNRLLGTTRQGVSFGRDPGLAVAQEGLVAATKPRLAGKIAERIGSLETEKQSALANTPGSFDVQSKVTQPVADAMNEAARTGNSDLYNKLSNVRDQLTGEYQPAAFDIQTREPAGPLVRTGERNLTDLSAPDVNQLKRDVGNVTDWRQQGINYRQPFNQVKAELYRNLDSTLDNAVPGYDDINSRQSNLISAKKDIGAQIARDQRRSMFGLGDAYSAGIGMGADALMGHGSPVEAMLAPLALIAAKRLGQSTPFGTFAARYLAQPGARPYAPGNLAAAIASSRSR